jgi:UDP-glucose:(heptosyl)LPS alpha-1,3-glucosyltransferase
VKIGLVRRGFSATGGAEKYLLRLAQELMRGGHEVVLFSDVAWPTEVMPMEDRAMEQVRIVSRGPLSFARGVRRMLPQRPCDHLLSLERVFACDTYRAGDGVHAAWLERRARFEPRWKRLFRWVNRKHAELLRLERALFTGGARRVIANSRMVKGELLDHYGYPEDRIDVIYNGVPAGRVDIAARAELRAELGVSNDDYVSLFVGSGWERKGLRVASDAVAEVSKAWLWIVGKGDAATINDKGSQRFLGERNDVPRLMAAADVFILPTIYDPFSNACLEALAAGLPVITTAANGFCEIIEAGLHGSIIADPADYLAGADALRYWQDRAVRESTRAARGARAAEFSMERNVGETVRVITGLEG